MLADRALVRQDNQNTNTRSDRDRIHLRETQRQFVEEIVRMLSIMPTAGRSTIRQFETKADSRGLARLNGSRLINQTCAICVLCPADANTSP